jgi:ATP-dependent DNA helicase RecG
MPEAPDPLSLPLIQLWGVGPDRSAQLARLKLHTVADLLLHRPRRYEDRRHFLSIRDLQLGQAATTRGAVVALGLKKYARGAKSVFELILDDGTARLHCRWWNLPFMEKYFQVGDEVFVFGKPNSLKPRIIDHPETEVIESGEESSLHINRIVPVYPLTEGLPQRWLRGLIARALDRFAPAIGDPHPLDALHAGPVPKLSRLEALSRLHFPEAQDDVELARRRLALDEFIDLQLGIRDRRRKLQANARSLPCAGDNRLIKPFLAVLGFKLTAAQTRVLREVRQDLRGPQPMRRLLQGDVGSGKTAVAACAALMALESGFSVALMAPTEILAGQHYLNFHRWLHPLGVSVTLRTGSQRSASHVSPGAGELVIGTHALVQDAFTIDNLGLVIIDEQHKFGVGQREQLVRKGRYPHLLVMTATPIPRTLGLTLYGDLDISVIDELPAGRGRIKTFVRTPDKLPKVRAFLLEKLAAGRQAYVVYPRVEENDLKTGLKGVKQEFTRLQQDLAPYQVGLLHGRLAADEKDRVMNDFRANRIQVLLATSVIEVGVDVPNATLMLIEGAEQFGLAQLHQLRGRVGRGHHDSCCILLANAKTDDARRRLRVMEETTDGFRIAEEDLKLRGPGELLGQDQSGLPSFRFGDLAQDLALVEIARDISQKLPSRDHPEPPNTGRQIWPARR